MKASSQEQLQGLELSVGSATIRQLNSFVLGRGSLAPDLSALNSNSTDLSSNPSMHIPAEESEENESPDDLDDWVEEESSAVNCHSASYAIDDLAIDETRSLNPPKQSVSKPSLPPRHTNTKTGFTLTVTFDQLPLGFTLSATHDAKAEVIRLREGGRAMQLGVNVNDVLIAIDNESIAHYHDAMERLTHTQLPVRLTFYRANFLRFHGELNGMVKSLTTSAKLEHDEHVFSSLKKNLSFSNVEGFS